MADSGDYVSGIPYPDQYHHDLDPGLHAAALFATGRARPPVVRRYLELGCGTGFSLAACAAARPTCSFTGVDADGPHVAALARTAQDVGLGNVQAVHDDAASPAVGGGEPFDIVAAHGLWSWVGADVRSGVRDLLPRLLRQGGLFYLSYNCLPGMAALEPVRRLLNPSHGHDTVLRRIAEARSFLARFIDTGPQDARLATRIAEMLEAPDSYLAHEYYNRHWTSFYFEDVASDLAASGLSFACSSRAADAIEAARFSAKQQVLLDAERDALRRETLKDFFLYRTFRTDLFTRGGPVDEGAAAPAQRFISTTDTDRIPTAMPERYRAVLDAAATMPVTLDEIVRDARCEGSGSHDLRAILVELLAMNLVATALPDGDLAANGTTVRRFNRSILSRWSRNDIEVRGLLSRVTGGLVPLRPEVMLALHRRRARELPAGTQALIRNLDIAV